MTDTEKVCPTEHEEQVVIFDWASLMSPQHPELELLFAIPNGSYKSRASARKFAAEGLKSGVPDICLPVPSPDGKHTALYIELKRRHGGKVSDTQKWWIERLTAAGCKALVCKGADEAITEIERYLTNDNNN